MSSLLVRDVVASDTVRGLLPRNLIDSLITGAVPAGTCHVCHDDLTGDPALSVAVHLYPHRGIRHVRVAHRRCATSTVTVAAPHDPGPPPLPTRVHSEILHPTVAGGRPLLIADSTTITITDPVTHDGTPLPGQVCDLLIPAGLDTGLTRVTTLGGLPARPVDGWSIRLTPAAVELHTPTGTATIGHQPDSAWTALARTLGHIHLYLARIGLLHRPPRPHPGRDRPHADPATRPTHPLLTLADTVRDGHAAAGRIRLTDKAPA